MIKLRKNTLFGLHRFCIRLRALETDAKLESEIQETDWGWIPVVGGLGCTQAGADRVVQVWGRWRKRGSLVQTAAGCFSEDDLPEVPRKGQCHLWGDPGNEGWCASPLGEGCASHPYHLAGVGSSPHSVPPAPQVRCRYTLSRISANQVGWKWFISQEELPKTVDRSMSGAVMEGGQGALWAPGAGSAQACMRLPCSFLTSSQAPELPGCCIHFLPQNLNSTENEIISDLVLQYI